MKTQLSFFKVLFTFLTAWMIKFFIIFVTSIPFYIIWNKIAIIYFSFLPDVWYHLPFWHIVGLFWIMSTISEIFLTKIKINKD